MSNENIISIIVPVYNTENFLRKCLDSILNQTYCKLEIILIDDGSTDSSGAICDEYAKNDDRIVVVHQKNKGLSAARNEGIRIASSPYTTFVDSDDYIELDTYEAVAKSIEEYHPDLVFFREKSVDTTGKTIFVYGEEPTGKTFLEDKIFAENRIIKEQINGMCDKVYRSTILKNISFQEGRIHGEDSLYNILAIDEVEKVVYIDQIKYSYVTNSESITRRSFSPAAFDQFYFKDKIASIVAEKYPEYIKLCNKRAFLARLHICRPIFRQHLENEYAMKISEINDYLRNNRSTVVLNGVENVEYWLYFHSKLLYNIYIKLVGLRKH